MGGPTISKKKRGESTRWEWQQYDCYLLWFDQFEIFVKSHGYGYFGCVHDKDGNLLSKVTIPQEKLHRMLNPDETQVPLNTDRSDAPSMWVFIDKTLPDPGQKTSKSSIHLTGLFGTTAAGEFLPVVLVCDSDAEDQENCAVSIISCLDLPVVQGKFGLL